jgi:hypothetical protein
MGAWGKEMKAVQETTDVNLTEMKAETRANNKKFDVLQGTLVSRMDIHQAWETVAVAEVGGKSGTQS